MTLIFFTNHNGRNQVALSASRAIVGMIVIRDDVGYPQWSVAYDMFRKKRKHHVSMLKTPQDNGRRRLRQKSVEFFQGMASL
jgi:hypothetical protein